MQEEGKLDLIASKSFPPNDELVKVIDFINKSLKDKNLMLGIRKDKKTDQMVINIYEY